MFFRFLAALILAVVVSLVGNVIERRNLDLRRELAADLYRLEVLEENHIKLRMEAERLGAPARLWDSVRTELTPPAEPAAIKPKTKPKTARVSEVSKSKAKKP